MKADDPLLFLIPMERRPSVIMFVQTGVPDKQLQSDINTSVQCQYSLLIRARYEENCLVFLHQHQRVATFLQTIDNKIWPDLLQFFLTEHVSPGLAAYLEHHEKSAQLLNDFIRREQLRSQRWERQIFDLDVDAIDQAMVLTRRFQRLRLLWLKEPEILDRPALHLVDPAWRLYFQIFIANGITDERFAQFLQVDVAGLEAVKIQVAYEERLLYIPGFLRRLGTLLNHIDSAWRSDLLACFTAWSTRQEFIDYLNTNQDADGIFREFIATEKQLETGQHEKIAGLMGLGGTPDTGRVLSRAIRDIRRRWVEERLRSARQA